LTRRNFQEISLTRNRNKPIIVELEFNWRYTSSQDPPKLVGIFQTSEKDLTVRKFQEISSFGVVQWFLQNRLGTCLRKNWVVKNKVNLEDIPGNALL
jgi:hypothetical protein